MIKNRSQKSLFLLAGLIIAAGLTAQSAVEVKIIQDGKIIKDTTYMVKDEASTKMAVKMLDITLGKEPDKKESNVYTFRSKDGKTYKFITVDDSINKSYEYSYYFSGDNDDVDIKTVIIDEEGEKVIKKDKISKRDDFPERKTELIIMKKGEKSTEKGDDIEWIEKGDHKILIIDNDSREEAVKIIKQKGDDKNSEFITEDGKKIIIKESGEGEEKEIEVKVIEKEKEVKKNPEEKEK